MSVRAAPRDQARRRQWGDAARRRRTPGLCAGARQGGAGLGAPGLGGRWGGAQRHPRPTTSLPRPTPPGAAPTHGASGATCARRAVETGRGLLGSLWGLYWGHTGGRTNPWA